MRYALLLCFCLLLAGCAGTKPKPDASVTAASAGSTPPRAEAKSNGDKSKTIADLTKGSRKLDGLFPVYQDTTNGALMLALDKTHLDREYIYFTHTVDGAPVTGHFRGRYGNNYVFSLRKNLNKIEILGENTAFYFDPTSPLAKAAKANISPSVLSVHEIVAQDSAKGQYLIKADNLFLSETFDQIKPSPNPNARPGEQFSLGQLSKEKTRYTDVHNYPENTDVVVEYVYENPSPMNWGGPEITDARNVSIRVQHSLIAMPQNGYQARLDDPRVGYFNVTVTDLTSASVTPYRDLINRWNLVKKDPNAALSEPVEPIVWWIENTTPTEWRPVIADAVLAWNGAFEAAGFKNAVQVKVQPDDATWEAGDIRYNVLRWTSSPTPPFGGYGPSFVNPRTGQIIGADVMLEHIFLTNNLLDQKLFDTSALNLDVFDGDEHRNPQACNLGLLMQRSLLFGKSALRAAGASDAEMSEMVRQSMYYLILHEVGHTLGLNHNMKASQMLSPEELTDADLAAQKGLYGSVMDYPTLNLAPSGSSKPVLYYTTRPGPYDVWAITYGYSPASTDAAAEQTRLNTLLARSTEPALTFGNDADDMRSAGKAIDPRVMIYDLSSDAIGYSVDRIKLASDLMSKVKTKYADPGDSYADLRVAYLILTGEQGMAAQVISRYIGGVYVDRAFAGQDGATEPFRPVPLADQKRAMLSLRKHVFAPNAFEAPEGLYNYLQSRRRGFEFFSTTEDPKIHSRVLNMQRSVLDHVMHPVVQARIVDTRLYGNQYALADMMRDLTDAVFADDLRGNVNTFRQNLQVEYVNRLTSMVKGQTKDRYAYPAQSAALYNLKRLRTSLGGRRSGNEETKAHTTHLLHLIDTALETRS